MPGQHLFIFSHDAQIAWYTVFARAFQEAAPGNRTVLFVHGSADVERGRAAGCYDEVVDLLEGFSFDPNGTDLPVISRELEELENEAGESFVWDDVRTDRWLTARDDSRYTVAYLNHAFGRLIAEYRTVQPVAALGEYTMAIYRLAFRLFDRDDKRMFYPVTTRYFRRVYFETTLAWTWDRCIELYRTYVRDGIPADLEQIIRPRYEAIAKKDERPNYTQHQSRFATGYTQLRSLSLPALLAKSARALRSEVSDAERHRNLRASFFERGPADKLRRIVRERVNHATYDRLTVKSVPPGLAYGVYFFHYQPEYTSDALGRFYAEQQFLIRNIAAAMPAGLRLVVKEHPTMVGLRDRAVYEDITRHANVILADHRVDSGMLIRQSAIVFTIVGTPALEAMWIGKPAIMFGEYAFAQTNTISLCRSFWELGPMIRTKLAHKPSTAEIETHGMALLAAKYQASRPGQVPIAVELIEEFLADRENTETIKQSFTAELRSHGVIV
jgi:hypothetical protein